MWTNFQRLNAFSKIAATKKTEVCQSFLWSKKAKKIWLYYNTRFWNVTAQVFDVNSEILKKWIRGLWRIDGSLKHCLADATSFWRLIHGDTQCWKFRNSNFGKELSGSWTTFANTLIRVTSLIDANSGTLSERHHETVCNRYCTNPSETT